MLNFLFALSLVLIQEKFNKKEILLSPLSLPSPPFAHPYLPHRIPPPPLILINNFPLPPPPPPPNLPPPVFTPVFTPPYYSHPLSQGQCVALLQEAVPDMQSHEAEVLMGYPGYSKIVRDSQSAGSDESGSLFDAINQRYLGSVHK